MEKKVTLLALLLVFLMGFSILNSGGKAGYTGAPGSAGLCSNCHSGGNGTTNVIIQSNPPFVAGSYQPNINYRISITVQNQNYNHFGFACEILDTLNNDAGVMSNPDAGTKIVNSAGGRKNATHNAKKSGTGSATFEFDWQSPSNGNVTFYVGANAVNNDGGTSGDKPGKNSLNLVPAQQTSISKSQNNVAKIYPNPVENEFFLQANEKINEISLFDIKGKSYRVSMNGEGSLYRIFIQETIAPGTYIVQIRTQKGDIFYEKLYIKP